MWFCGETPPIPAIDRSSLLTLTSVSEATNLMVPVAAYGDEAGLVEVQEQMCCSMDE